MKEIPLSNGLYSKVDDVYARCHYGGGKEVRSIFWQNPNVLPKGRLTVKTGGPSAHVCCFLSFEVWICLKLRI